MCMNQEVEENNINNTIVVIIDGYVYDLTTFADTHPGGRKILERYNGLDATELFYSNEIHNSEWVKEILELYCLGTVTSMPCR